MTLTFDPSGDFVQVTDQLEAVTVRPRDSSADTAVGHALRRGVTTGEADASDGRYTAGDVAWHLPAAELPDPPQPGDAVIDADARRWTVLVVLASTLAGRWRCVARDLALAHGLDDYVDVEQAAYSKGDGGAEQAVWHPWRTGLRASIQPVRAAAEDQRQRQVTRTAYTVFLDEDLTLDHRHRVKGPDGTIYRVIGLRKAERIDALTEIDVERVDL
jgi:hypothetical protein